MSPIQFLSDVKSELEKVTWPTKEDVINSTVGVMLFTLAIAAYFWVLDMAFTKLLQFIIKQGV
ncbi:preprotein translocase subunit SecE [Desulfurobacterium atlanticum]|uniref:Protein translocase subunit SecE n=1 Tax=Desulfurobacterium atlanticum TaxID=240169 RepID=A0A238ZMJ0_9BACT|nr:preprotein translocase subunit SecE [Desulfurobacterium atlanticum]SNR84271.1 preprotein translocase subunit SecE [Desulfurobacterium atlanticum]